MSNNHSPPLVQTVSCLSHSAFERLLYALAEKRGPDAADYPLFEALLQQIKQSVCEGTQPKLVKMFWEALGESATSCQSLQGMARAKPHGYAGDFEIIDAIYRHHVNPDPSFRKWDEYFQAQQASRAVRNRKQYFISWLRKAELACSKPICRVLNLASGPGRDMLEYLETFQDSKVRFIAVDQDSKAIEYATGLCREFLHRISLERGNALTYRGGAPYELVWSAGLFDYFNDRLFVRVLKRVWKNIALGGEIAVGNFSSKNCTRAYMETLGWVLHHRSPEKLLSLAQEAGIPLGSTSIGCEPEGLNLFLHAKRE